MDKLFLSIYRQLKVRTWLAALVFVILLSGVGWLASQITFEEDITKLIPADEDAKELQGVLKSVNFTDKIIVNIQSRSGDANDLTAYASAFVDSLQPLLELYIEDLQGQVEDEDMLQTLNFVYDHLPVFLDEDDYKVLSDKVRSDSIEAATQANYKTLISPSGIIAKETILKDPLGISFIGLKKLQQLAMGDDFVLKDGFLLNQSEENLLLFITPKFKTNETDKNAPFAEALYRIQEQLNDQFEGKATAEYFGGALVAVANASQIKKDIQFTVGIALAVLMIIFVFFYRSILVPIVLFAPTLFGGLLSVATLFLIRGEISAISLGIGSVLLGVTLDYSLHILTHLRNNSDTKELYLDVTKPILMSSLTTAMAFLCLLFVNSQALQDLGIFAAVSVLGASVFALLFIPLVYRGGKKAQKQNTVFDTVAKYPMHKNKWVIAGLSVLLLVSAFTYNKVVFNNDISKLNYEPEFLQDAKNRLDALTHIASKSVYVATYGNDIESVLQQNDTIFTTLRGLASRGEIIDFSSAGALVQSKAKQQEKIERWRQFWDANKRDNVQAAFISSGNALGFKPNTFSRFYEHLNTSFETLELSDYKAFSSVSIDDYVSVKTDLITATSLVKLDDQKATILDSIFEEAENIVLVDRQKMNETLLGNLKNDFNRLIGYSLLVVLILLLIFYRSLSLTLVTSIPIALSWLLTIGMMGLLHIEFNIFNIIISTFIFGLGVDYSIFITNGLLKEYRTGERTLATHKTSILLSVITTLLGIGVLIFAKHPALYTISVVCMIGIFSAMLISFNLQPLLFRLFIGSPTKRPISLRLLLHSVLSFGYYGLGGFILSLLSVTLMKIIPLSKKFKMNAFHRVLSKFMKSVLYTNPFVKKRIVNEGNVDFSQPGILIANHTSFLDILAIGMLHPKIIFLVNDWVYHSPVFGKAVQMAGFYPVSSGIEKGVEHLRKKVDQGYCLMAFPEGTRSETNKIKRFHKGSFYLADELNLDVIPILIHGNSEVLPKGSFIIKDGSITVKILKRIPAESAQYGATSREKTKQMGAHFRSAFQKLRNEIEGERYFHSVILEDYRYKGDTLYREVKNDLKSFAYEYHTLIRTIGKKEVIAHVGGATGDLDFLLALDGPERKIYSLVENISIRSILQHSYITQTERKLQFIDSLDTLEHIPFTTLIVNGENSFGKNIHHLISDSVSTIVLIKQPKSITSQEILDLGFISSCQNKNLSIFKKTT